MIITIDGPAGSGKSTVAEEVARRLGFSFLNTGHMYRAIGLAARRREVDLNNPMELVFVAKHARIEFDWEQVPPTVILNGEKVTHLLGSKEVSEAASYVAVVPQIREMMVHQQQKIGQMLGNVVTEGRDQGTIVFPQADFKFYIDASPEERAHRRYNQMRNRGEYVEYKEVLDQILARDKRDRERLVGPLEKPKDAIEIDSTRLSFEEVVRQILAKVEGAGKPK
ncbi:MAG: cytidylate kinase [Phycisphaerae bacterium]|mgnify:CR=1 FL=1|jgi:cytidylate kinase|nr:MAG: cytidylate kinase [Phycisphaerae bacterium]